MVKYIFFFIRESTPLLQLLKGRHSFLAHRLLAQSYIAAILVIKTVILSMHFSGCQWQQWESHLWFCMTYINFIEINLFWNTSFPPQSLDVICELLKGCSFKWDYIFNIIDVRNVLSESDWNVQVLGYIDTDPGCWIRARSCTMLLLVRYGNRYTSMMFVLKWLVVLDRRLDITMGR